MWTQCTKRHEKMRNDGRWNEYRAFSLGALFIFSTGQKVENTTEANERRTPLSRSFPFFPTFPLTPHPTPLSLPSSSSLLNPPSSLSLAIFISLPLSPLFLLSKQYYFGVFVFVDCGRSILSPRIIFAHFVFHVFQFLCFYKYSFQRGGGERERAKEMSILLLVTPAYLYRSLLHAYVVLSFSLCRAVLPFGGWVPAWFRRSSHTRSSGEKKIFFFFF